MSDGHIFISYARADGRDYARRIDDDLRAAGFRTWRDTRDIDPYQDFSAELETAIEHASHVVCCVTPDVRRDDSFVRREIGYSLRLKKPIVPLIFQGTLPPIQIVNVTDVDFTRQQWVRATDTLIERLHRGDDRTYEQVRLPNDPYRDYLESLYDQIVKYLNLTVFSLITLKSESTPEAVERPRSLPMTFFAMAGVEDKVDEKIQFNNFHQAYEKYGGRVLLLGEPGAGKTTTLFAFAREKVAERLADPSKPLPILVPIATWDAQKQTPLADWLAEQLPILKRDDIDRLIESENVLLLLDGLDELGGEREVVISRDQLNLSRISSVTVVTEDDTNDRITIRYDPRQLFMMNLSVSSRGIVSCRIKDYAEINQKIGLKGAVTLQPLDDRQMKDYLLKLPDLWAALEADDELRDVARTPLLLSLFTFAFRDLPDEVKVLHDLKRGDLRDKIFESYVERRYEREARKPNANIPFTLDEIYEVLGKISIRQIYGQATLFEVRDIAQNLLSDKTQSELFAGFVLRLNLLTHVQNRYRYIHLLLRDFFGYRRAIHEVQDSARDTLETLLALEALTVLRDRRAVPILLKKLDGVNHSIQTKAIRALGYIADKRAVDSLIGIVKRSRKWEQYLAAWALGEIGDPRAVSPLIEALDESDDLGKKAISAALGKFGEPAMRPLIDILRNRNSMVRSRAAIALGLSKDQAAVEPLMSVLFDDDMILRRYAAEALGTLGDERAVTSLIQLLNDPFPDARGTAIWSLGHIRDERAVKPLISLLSDVTPAEGAFGTRRLICTLAAEALEHIRTPEALEAVDAWRKGWQQE